MSGPDLLQVTESYKGHNGMVRAAQAGLTAAQAKIKTGKLCLDCGEACYPWEKVCKPCGKKRLKSFVRAKQKDGAAFLALVTEATTGTRRPGQRRKGGAK